MSTINHEKYISIEYEIWKNKYLPLEETVKKLQKEIEDEKKRKTITIKLETASLFKTFNRSNFPYDYQQDKVIGYLYTDDIVEINELTRSNVLHVISNNLNIMDEKTAKKYLEDINAGLLKIDQETLAYFNIIENNRKNYKKIPKLIRWMFNIKL